MSSSARSKAVAGGALFSVVLAVVVSHFFFRMKVPLVP